MNKNELFAICLLLIAAVVIALICSFSDEGVYYLCRMAEEIEKMVLSLYTMP